MKKELPKIFKNNIDSTHNTNKKIYYASNYKEDNNYRNTSTISNNSLNQVEEKIRKLFKSSRYIFNINVLIKTNTKDYNTKIAGKVHDNIITTDGEHIPISSITDIIIKDRI